jgi:hypothetical protein
MEPLQKLAEEPVNMKSGNVQGVEESAPASTNFLELSKR